MARTVSSQRSASQAIQEIFDDNASKETESLPSVVDWEEGGIRVVAPSPPTSSSHDLHPPFKNEARSNSHTSGLDELLSTVYSPDVDLLSGVLRGPPFGSPPPASSKQHRRFEDTKKARKVSRRTAGPDLSKAPKRTFVKHLGGALKDKVRRFGFGAHAASDKTKHDLVAGAPYPLSSSSIINVPFAPAPQQQNLQRASPWPALPPVSDDQDLCLLSEMAALNHATPPFQLSQHGKGLGLALSIRSKRTMSSLSSSSSSMRGTVGSLDSLSTVGGSRLLLAPQEHEEERAEAATFWRRESLAVAQKEEEEGKENAAGIPWQVDDLLREVNALELAITTPLPGDEDEEEEEDEGEWDIGYCEAGGSE